jgi:tetratricopeptide (TPR) repeat protein
MLNLLVALAVGVAVFAAVTALWGPIAAVFPAVFFAGLALFLLARRIGSRVNAELEPLMGLLQARRIEDARALLLGVKARYARWQLLLGSQIDAQLGMLEYLQLHWDEALPLLEKGRWRNGQAFACIGAIHWRRGDKTKAFEALARAQTVAPKDPMVAVVRATLLLRDDRREEALRALSDARGSLSSSKLILDLQARVAKKQKVDTKQFGEGWYQYFPEDLAREMVTRGRRTPVPGAPQAPQAPRFGARHAPRR